MVVVSTSVILPMCIPPSASGREDRYRHSTRRDTAGQYPLIRVTGLIVSAASFAWTVYSDLRTKTDAPARDVIERRVRVKVRDRAVPRRSARICRSRTSKWRMAVRSPLSAV